MLWDRFVDWSSTYNSGQPEPENYDSSFSSDANVETIELPEVTIHAEKYFGCPLCDQKFTSKVTARRHLTSLHSNIRYACQVCKRTFNRKDALKTHIQKAHQIDAEVAAAMTNCNASKSLSN